MSVPPATAMQTVGRRCSPAVLQSQENTRFPRRFPRHSITYIYDKRSRGRQPARSCVQFFRFPKRTGPEHGRSRPGCRKRGSNGAADLSTSTGNGGDLSNKLQIVLHSQFIQPGAPRAVLRLMNPNLASYRFEEFL